VATSSGTLADIRKAGYLPILCDTPEKVSLITASNLITGSDLLMSAMLAVNKSSLSDVRSDMVKELYRRLNIRELESQATQIKK
jgi:hypothetical protein